MKIEKRFFSIRSKKTDEGPVINGYPAKFNKLSEDLGPFRERIDPGAFTDTIKNADVRALFNHDSHYVLGRTRSGTLELSEDEIGLAMVLRPPDTGVVRDMVITPIDRGDITQMSFGFVPIDSRWEEKEGQVIRILQKVDLFDVSIVTFPAYPDTEVALRSLEQWRNNPGRGDASAAAAAIQSARRTREIQLKQKRLEM